MIEGFKDHKLETGRHPSDLPTSVPTEMERETADDGDTLRTQWMQL